MSNWRKVLKIAIAVVFLVAAVVMISFGLVSGMILTTGSVQLFEDTGSFLGRMPQQDDRLTIGIFASMLFFAGAGGFLIAAVGFMVLVGLSIWSVIEFIHHRRRNLAV